LEIREPLKVESQKLPRKNSAKEKPTDWKGEPHRHPRGFAGTGEGAECWRAEGKKKKAPRTKEKARSSEVWGGKRLRKILREAVDQNLPDGGLATKNERPSVLPASACQGIGKQKADADCGWKEGKRMTKKHVPATAGRKDAGRGVRPETPYSGRNMWLEVNSRPVWKRKPGCPNGGENQNGHE